MASSRPVANRQIIVGRKREQTQLGQLLDDTIAGHGSLVLICGEAWIGKTTLVDDISAPRRHLAKRSTTGSKLVWQR